MSAGRHIHDWIQKPAVVDPETKRATIGGDGAGQRVFAVTCVSCGRGDIAFGTIEEAEARLQVLRRASLVNAYNGMGPARRARLARKAARNAAGKGH